VAEHEHSEENRRSRRDLASMMGRLTDADLARPLPEGWTVGASLAYMAFWDRHTALVAARWIADGTPTPASLDAQPVTDALLPLLRAIPGREAAHIALDAAAAADRALEALPAALLDAARASDSPITLNSARHRAAHLAAIAAAVAP
jgi:hypothetical protein